MPALPMLRQLVGLRNPGLDGHERRLGRYASVLCREMGLGSEFSEAMGKACSFHDLGKVVLPDAILLKPTALTPTEWQVMCTHSSLGFEILRQGSGPISGLAASIALSHHESFDGSGYPNRLKGNAIPLEARIAAVCDVYDALREDRVYRAGLSHQNAMEIITNGDGITRPEQFDPKVLDSFVTHADIFAEFFEEFQSAEPESHSIA